MIVLGPHVQHHCCHHALTEEDGEDAESSADRHNNAILSSSGSGNGSGSGSGGCDIVNEDRHEDVVTTTKSSPFEVRCDKMLFQARVEISKSLGSLGAPPLSSVDCSKAGGVDEKSHNIRDLMTINATQQLSNEKSVQTYLDSVVELATAHTALLQTMQSCIHMLTVGTGIHLGIGPNNIPAAKRAERAWLERELLRNDAAEATVTQSCTPRLTLHRCRQILHHAIVDEAILLQNIVSLHKVNVSGILTWNEFFHDLKHTLEADCVLTLSRLTKWMEGVGKFLGALLSEFLSPYQWRRLLLDETHSVYSLVTTITSSIQMAKERQAFLQSAFSMPSSSTTTRCEDNMESACNNKHNPEMRNLIDLLRSNLEGASISLWAFEESHSRSDQSEPDLKSWLEKLKDLMEGSCGAAVELDSLFRPCSDDGDKDMTDESSSFFKTTDGNCTNSSSLLVSDGAIADESVLLSVNNETKKSMPLDKTLIFAGNGSHKRSQIKPKDKPAKSQVVPNPRSFFNQSVLLRDLQNRLKTMGLAEEYEVAAATDSTGDGLTLAEIRRPPSRQGNDIPMFLGVQGTALAELSSLMGHQREKQVIIE